MLLYPIGAIVYIHTLIVLYITTTDVKIRKIIFNVVLKQIENIYLWDYENYKNQKGN